MQRRRSVALLIETSNAYARGLLAGVVAYVRRHQPWSIYLPEQDRAAAPPRWLAGWQGDGIIARIETAAVARAIRSVSVPVVDLSAARLVKNVPWLETDDGEIARLAADHLMQRGFKHFGFCGDAAFNWSRWRREHFQQTVERAGGHFHCYESSPQDPAAISWDAERRRMAQWLSRLPRPIGLMASYDIKAQFVLDVCRELEISVPEEIAVIGVDNDELLCSLSDPPLSSVVPNAQRTGYDAAHLLDRLMSGESVPAEAHFIPPLGVETRQSTDVLAIDDVEVATAVRFIRQHAATGIKVSEVLRAVPLSRRVLESRFTRVLGHTPHEEIMRQRISRLKQLLAETDLPLREIASRAGFEHTEYLTVVFKRETGQTPTEFRNSAVAR